MKNPISIFAADVDKGLSSFQKTLSSRYFYDKRGSEIFQEIMHLEEYYPTDCEKEIFEKHSQSWNAFFSPQQQHFHLIEFGAGDGLKTKILLKNLLQQQADFSYLPIDISRDSLIGLQESLAEEIPDLQVKGLSMEYFEALQHLQQNEDTRKIVLFLGSNLGNFAEKDALAFLLNIRKNLSKGDFLLIGLDLVKNPQTILNAYSDAKGVTKAFNLNLLHRINRELGANFIPENFEHYASYDAISGTCKSFLISLQKQEVYIEVLQKSFEFETWEAIHTENSQKYTISGIAKMAQESGFEVVKNFFDEKQYFVDSLWKVQ